MRKLYQAVNKFFTMLTVVTTIIWSIGISALMPGVALAVDVTVSGPFDLLPSPSGTSASSLSFEIPVIRFALNKTSGGSEALSSVTVTVTSTAPTNNATLASHLASAQVFQDSNGNNFFDPQADLMAGSQSTVNVGSATTVATNSNNSLAAAGNLPTSFFVVIRTAAGWAAGDSIYINMAADGIATSANSPTITPLVGSKYVNFGGGGGWGGFSVSNVSYLNATTVDVSFTDNLDLNSGNATSTSNYTLKNALGVSQTISSISVLPDNKSVRITAAPGVTVASNGTWTVTISNAVKNSMGMANGNTSPTPIMSATMPLVISEVKIGTGADQYDEFIEIYNRSEGSFPTSSLKLHIVNAAGTVDTNVSLTFRGNGTSIPARGYLLITPVSASASSSADATYATSTLLSLVANGAMYISNSVASSSAVIDKVCWGSHSVMGDCEGSSFSSLAEDGKSMERKAFNGSTSISMVSDTNGNSIDTQNNSYDFVLRDTPQPQSTASNTETPSGGSYGGDSNQQPQIQLASIFRATASSTFNLVARMTDDGGPLPAANTQLIFCTDNNNTCAPASSSPIYGVSIGSGWFKFTPTSTPWSNNKTYFRYYLQAADSATPPKSRVFTNNPTYDSATYLPIWAGIQTQADQIAKAFSVTLVQGNLGTASINGTVNDSTGAAVSGATVWIEGTQFAATTGNDGTFSFANVGPSGGVGIKVARDGYMDQSISTYLPTSGLVSLGTITLYSGNMGQGGDYTMPRVVSSFPQPGMMGFPTQQPGGGAPIISVTFSKSMDSTTITDTDASNAGSNIYLTEAGSNTKLGGSVAIISGNMGAIFTPGNSVLTTSRSYSLFITPGVKDAAGNPISGNGPGGAYVLSFGTTGQMFTDVGQIGGNFGTGNAFPPFVVGSQPAPGKVNVATTSKAFVTFSDSLQNTAGNLANVKLYKVANSYTASESKTLVTATNSLDASQKLVIVTPTSLDVSSAYRIEVTGGLTSSKGVSLGNPGTVGYATTVMYKSDFQTGASSDGSAPTVLVTIPADSATGVSTIKPVVVSFSEAMDPSTITETSVSLKLGSSVVASDLTYDSNNRTATIVPDYALTASSTYTITITTDVRDLSGNAIASLLRTFTTGSADTTAPSVTSAQANDISVKVGFSRPMLAVSSGDINYANSVLKPANYTIRRVVSSTGAVLATIATTTATITYDAANRSAVLSNISGIANGDFVNISVANVKDIAFNDIATGAAGAATTTGQTSAKTGDFSMGGMGMAGPQFDSGGNMIQGGMMGGGPVMVGTFQASGIGFAPGVKVRPFNTMAGVSTIYGVEIPISYQVPNAGFIDITFPEGTDVSNAKKDTDSPPNADLNGPGSGTVVFGSNEGTLPTGFTTGGAASDGVIVNSTSRVVRVILGAVATRRGTGNLTTGDGDQHDFIRLDIAQIINSTLSTGIDTAGSSATVETKKADGTVLETLSSGSFFTSAAGTLEVRGRVLSGATGVNGVNVFLMSPMTGPMSSSSASSRYGGNDGEFRFQNLVAGNYMLGVDQYFKAGATSYTASFPTSININATNCASNVCTQNVSITDASTGATVTLNITGTFTGQAIDIFAGGPGSFRKATSTLDGTLTNDTSNTIKLNTNGVWMIGFGPQMSTEMFGKSGPTAPTTWMPPRPQEVMVSGCPGACSVTPASVSFNVSATVGNPVKFKVQDASGNAIGNAHVFAYSPGDSMGNDTMANADGTGSIRLSEGTYKIGADVAGMPSGQERTIKITATQVFLDGSATGITLATMANSDLVLTLSKPPYTISGKVTDGTNAVTKAPINAYRTDGPGHADAITNSSGEYTLYVNNGTWKVQAFTPDYGKLPEKTITVASANVTGQNFEPNTASTNYATVTKSVAIDADADGALEAGEGLSNAQIIVEGTTSGGEKYFNSSLTDTNGSSTLKVPPGTYTMKAWSPTYGEMSSTTQSLVVNSSGVVTTAPYDVLAPKTGNITVNFFDSDGNATSTSKAVVEFMQIGGKIDKVGSYSNVSSTLLSLPIFDAGATTTVMGNVTSTNPSNFYLMEVSIPGVSQASLAAYGDENNTVMTTSTATVGAWSTVSSTAIAGFWKVEIDGNETINIKLPAIKYVNGTVKDGSGTVVPNATVHLENKTTGEAIEVQADSSGSYSTKLSAGTYLVQADKDGYVDTASTVTISNNGALADSATTIAIANYTISGTIQTAGTAVAGATVRAEKLGGGVVTALTGSDGIYNLKVTSGNWKVSASADGYTEKQYGSVVTVGTADVSSVNINLTATNSSLAGSTSASVTPQTGGSLSDTTANFNIGAGGTAIGPSANSYSLNEKETSNVVGGSSGVPITGEAKSVVSYDNDGNAVTTLKKDVAVSASYSLADMTSALTDFGSLTVANLQKIKMSSWDDTADNWQNLPTTVAYKNSSGNFIEPSTSAASLVYTGQTSHFSVFNPLVSSDRLAPSAPTALTNAYANSVVTVTWTAPTTNADGSTFTDLLGYEIYRSTSIDGTYTQLNSSNISGTSYTDSSVTQGSIYFYKVTAADTGGLESAMSTASTGVTITTNTGGQNMTGSSSPSPSPAPVPVVVATTTLTTPALIQPVAATPATVTTPVSAAVTAPVTAEASGSARALEVAVANPESGVTISPPSVSSYQPSEKVVFNYSYTNSAAKTVKVKLQRDLLYKNKLVKRSAGSRTIKPGAGFTNKISEVIPRSYKPGDYTIVIKVLNQKNKVLDQNSFTIAVEKEKKKYLTVGEISNSDSDLSIDSAVLAKANNKSLSISFKVKFGYVNNSEVRQTVRMVRELLNEDGKAIQRKSGKWIMAPGEEDAISVTQVLAKNLSAGNYTLRLAAYDWKTKELFAENSVSLIIGLK